MNELGGYAFADLRVGMCATFAKTITEADIVLFAAVSGDNNAIHINEEFAAGTIFKGRIAHGMLSASDRATSCPDRAASSVAKPAIQGACPGQRYCPCDRHGQTEMIPVRDFASFARKRGCPCLGGRPRKRQQANSMCHATLVEPVQRRQQYRGEGNDDVIGNQHSERRPVQCWPG